MSFISWEKWGNHPRPVFVTKEMEDNISAPHTFQISKDNGIFFPLEVSVIFNGLNHKNKK
jgi:hypothetical protein